MSTPATGSRKRGRTEAEEEVDGLFDLQIRTPRGDQALNIDWGKTGALQEPPPKVWASIKKDYFDGKAYAFAAFKELWLKSRPSSSG